MAEPLRLVVHGAAGRMGCRVVACAAGACGAAFASAASIAERSSSPIGFTPDP